MKSFSKKPFLVLLCGLLILASSSLAPAGGPISLFDSGTPTLWGGGVFATFPIPYLKDQGPLGPLSNSEADALTIFSMNEWDAVSTSTFSVIDGGDTPFDITSANASNYLFNFHGAVIDVVYDDNGSICTAVFGCPPGVLGLGGPIFVGTTIPEIASALVLMNGAAINPSDTGGTAYRIVFSQESGHAIGLHHDQTNGAVSFFGDESAPTGCPSVGAPVFSDFTAMYPFASVSPTGPGAEAASIDHPEDLHALSRFHPVATYSATTGTITGTVFQSDGITPVNGVNVIVRSVTDPFGDARSTITGDLSISTGDAFEGTFVLTGLTPGTNYTLAIDNIVDGAFPQPPAPSFTEEYWNDTSESSNSATDNPCDLTPIIPVAGSTVVANFVLNGPDTTGPTVTIDEAVGQLDPTSASPINFAVVFSEVVTDFNSTDVTVSGTAGATAGVVTGSGTTYNVAISDMTGPGTVVLDIAAGVATDGLGNPNSVATILDNTVTFDATAPPVITSNGGGPTANVLVAENTTAVTTVIATDADGTTPTFGFPASGNGVDESFFTLTPAGVLTFTSAPDFETPQSNSGDNTYEVVVEATDGLNTDTQALSVTVTPINDAPPVITSNGGGPTANVLVAENTTAVTTVIATDADGTTPTFGFPASGNGVDESFFTLTPAGVLTFTSAPDFETPQSNSGDNTYEVVVEATDGFNTDTQALSVTVTNIDDTGPTVTINQAPGQADPTNTSPINFTVVFSEPVNNFATGDVTVSGAGATTGTVSEIAPNDGTTYNVAVGGDAGAYSWDGNPWADYSAFMSPITFAVKANLHSIMTAGQASGRALGRMGQIGDSITNSSAYFRNGILQGSSGNETNHDYSDVRSWMAYSGTQPADSSSFYNLLGKGIDYANNGGWTVDDAVVANHPSAAVEVGDGVTPGNFSWALLMFGTNDIDNPSWDAQTWKTDYSAFVQGFINLGVIPVLSTIPPEQAHIGDGRVELANEQIKALAIELNIPFVDYYALVLHYQPVNWVGTLISGDGTHPSAGGGGRDFSQNGLTVTDGYAARTKLTWDMAEKLKAIVFDDGTAEASLASDGTVIVSIAAGVASDSLGNTNTASTSTDNTVTFDTTGPTVTIEQAIGQADPTNTSPITFTVVFSAPVSGFASAGVTVSGTANPATYTVAEIAPNDGTTYTVAVSGMTTDGTVIAAVLANAATDGVGNGNTASTSTDNTVTFDTTGPTVTIDQATAPPQLDPTSASPINFAVVFSESVADFDSSDVTVSGTAGATAGTVTGSGTTYNVAISDMTGPGTVVLDIAAGVATDGLGNPNSVATILDNTVTFDATAPTVTIDQATAPPQLDPTSASPINFAVVFSESVADFDSSDVTVSGTAGATAGTVTGSGTTYNVAISDMTGPGTVVLDIAAGVATDGLGNPNSVATILDNTVTFDATAPTVTIDQATATPQVDPTSASPINFAVVFSESVSDFDSSDVTVSGTADATAGVVTGSGTTYNVAISDMTGPGTVVLDIAAGVATDGLGNPNSVATILDNTVTFVVPGEEFQQDSGVDGLVSLEAEHADSNTPQGAHSWSVATSVPGFSGDSAMAATPNTGINNDTNYAALSPRLDFDVNFVHTGTHYVWIRGIGATNLDDSVHVGLDGQELASSDRIDGFGTSWTWLQSTRDGVVATMQIDTVGPHTVNVWMREDGVLLDKVVLTINASFPTPVGEGPPESLQGPPPPLHTLNVTVNGSGSVTSVPSGVACPGTCSVDYTEGTVVILTAVGDSGFGFDGWSGACTDTGTCNVTMDQAQAVTATFSLLPPTPQTLTVTLSGNGTVSSVPGGINCPGTCTADFPQATVVTLTAQADPDSVFAGWSGAGCSGMEPCVVPMTQPENVTATFEVPGAEFQQDSGVDGLVALEAEHADSNTPQGVHSWSVATSVPGFSGDSAMAATPNTGINNDTNYAALSPRLDFAVNFVHTGTHYVWIRGIGATNLDDSVHVGLDGQELASSDRIDGFGTSWTWLQSTRDGVVATMQVDTVGPHTVNVWMREDGVLLDKVVLTINASFPTPVGEGPPESLQGPPPPLHTLNVTVNGSGSVTSVPSGVACPGTCSVDYTEGTVVILTAVGDSGFGFDGWSGACTDTGTCNVTMDQAQAVTATFSLLPPTPQTLTVTLSGNGTVSSVPGGINCPGTCTADFPQATVVTLTAQADPDSVFAGWSGAGCSGMEPCVVPMTQPENVTATFEVPGAEFQQDSGVDGLVALEAEHADSNTPQGVHSWSVATSVPGFSGDSAMAATPNTGINNDTNYAALSPRLDFAVNFVHTGTHYVWIRGIGATNLDDSVHVGLDGQELASSDRIDGFGTSWTWLQSTRDGVVATMQVDTVGPHTVNVWMREDGVLLDKVVLTINASFPTPVGEGPPESLQGPPPPLHTLNVTVNGSGSVTSVPSGVACPGTCSVDYTEGTVVILTAVGDSGFGFDGWSGACTDTGTCNVTMDQAQAVTATFSLLPPTPQTLTVTLSGNGTVSSVPGGINCPGTCTADFPQATVVTLTAQADPDSVFAGWSGAGCSGMEPCVVPMTQPENVTATFEVPGAEFQQDSGIDGLVALEAEHADSNTPQGVHSWSVATSVPGFSGDSAMAATPNTGTNNNTNYAALSPRLDFAVNFVHTGTHYVWIRGIGATNLDDSVHVGLDGQELASSDRIDGFGASWTWLQSTRDGVVATMQVDTVGPHTVNVWMREDGFVLDKVVLTINASFPTPVGEGPPESLQGPP